jgi:16S rRNA (cytidine1402-2'-O)-methyltransferase
MLETLLHLCKPSTMLCIAAELTSQNEWIKTKSISEWKKEKTDLHKKPVIFLLMG